MASCCVPGCRNNWRNSPELKFHTIPIDPEVRKEYKRLIKNKTLKESSKATRICGKHFPAGERVCRSQLPSIFSWSIKPVKKRREIVKHDILKKEKVSKLCENVVSEVPIMDHEDANLDNQQHVQLPQAQASQSESETTTTSQSNIKFINTALVQPINEAVSELHDINVQVKCQESEAAKLLQLQLDSLQKQYDKLKYHVEHEPKFDIEFYKDSDENITFFTGFPNYSSMMLCFDVLKDKAANLSYGGHSRVNFETRKVGPKRKLTLFQEFVVVLLRLRLGLLERDLADRFRISVSTVSDIFRTWIKFMSSELKPLCIVWPCREQLQFYMPAKFKELYPELVVIIDCTEIWMESPSSLDKQAMCYSSYKSHTTLKSLVGITPNGAVSFVSDLYCGSISDPDIVLKSRFLENINKGDLIMADKGFIIQDQLAAVGARLVIPNFLSNKGQFSQRESEQNKKIASLRIHIERYMERLKNWHLFDRVIPISTASIASDAWIVVACLSNFWPPIIS